MKWRENASRIHIFIKDVSSTPPGINFPRPVSVNGVRTGIGLFRSETYKWGVASTRACKCGAKEQTAEHIITFFPFYHNPNKACALSDINKNLVT